MGLNIHVRVIKPVAVDRTEVTIYPIRLVGAPAAMNFGNIRLLNVTHSAASFVQTDDLESFMRAQKGLRSRADRLGRYLARPGRRGARPRRSTPRAASPPTRWWCARNTMPGSDTCARRHDGRRRAVGAVRCAGERAPFEQFLLREARLLDERRFREWMDLFADDGTYWVPAVPDQQSPFDQASLFYDDRELMQTRIERLEHPRIHVQTPPSRTAHLVGNCVVDKADEPMANISSARP